MLLNEKYTLSQETIDRYQKNKRKFYSLTLVMMFILQLILPVGLHAYAQGADGDSEDPTTVELQSIEDEDNANEESAMSLMSQAEEETEAVEEVEEVVEQEKVEEPAPEPPAPPAEEPKEETSPDPAPKPEEKPAEEKPQEEVKEEAKEEAGTKDQEETTEDSEKEEDIKEEEEVETEEEVEEKVEIEEEEEFDPMLDGFPATEHPKSFASIITFAAGSLGSALADKSSARMMNINTNTELQPGEVRTSKTATPVPGMVNTWDITVRIEGRDDQLVQTTDVVLVIDRSGSMSERDNGWSNPTRLGYAKQAAIDFIDRMIPEDDNLRISIVSFSSEYQGAQLVTINHDFSRNRTTLKNAVNSLTALGGTHTQAGIIQGEELLIGSDADNKYMVLLSDGQPTFSYEPTNWTNGRPSWGTTGGVGDSRQLTGVYDGNFNTNTVVGTGNDLRQSYTTGSGNNVRRRHIDNGAAAIKAGQDARANFDGLFTIAVQAGDEGTPILEDIASPGMAYSTSDPAELAEIYNRIGTAIQTQYALKNAVVVDEMGDGFTLIGSVNTSEGTTSIANASGASNQTITWTINPQVTQLVPGTTDVRYAKMTYRVEINPDILNASVATPGSTSEHDLFKTNKFTELSYKDTNDEDQQKPIISPEVDPVLLKVKKILKDEAGNIVNQDPRRFNVRMWRDSTGFDHTEALVPGADYVVLTTLRYEGTYNVEEISITGDGNTNLEDFIITYNIDGDEQTQFIVNHDTNGIPRGDVVIEVTNQAIERMIDFTFTKVDDAGEPLLGSEFTLEKEETDGSLTPIANVGDDPVFTFEDLTEGTYILTETKAPPGHKLPTGNWVIYVVKNETTGRLELVIPDDSFLAGNPDDGYEVGNEPQSEFPQTGGLGALTYVSAGISVLVTSVGLYYKKNENEVENHE